MHGYMVAPIMLRYFKLCAYFYYKKKNCQLSDGRSGSIPQTFDI